MTHTVIFDIGGTLIDAPDLFEVLAERANVESELIKALFEKYYKGSKFFTVKEILQNISKDLMKKVDSPDFSTDFTKIYFETYVNNSSLSPYTITLLKNLKHLNINLIVLSDSDAEVLIPEMKLHKIFHYFDKILISSELGTYKASKEIRRFLDPLLMDKSQVLLIGNSEVDKLAAKNLGITSILISKNIQGDINVETLEDVETEIKREFRKLIFF